MRRWGLVFAILALAGCKALGDAFSAHPQVAGSAAGQTLTVSRLAELAGRAKKVPLRPQALTGLTTIYLDYAVFAHELARGRDMADSGRWRPGTAPTSVRSLTATLRTRGPSPGAATSVPSGAAGLSRRSTPSRGASPRAR